MPRSQNHQNKDSGPEPRHKNKGTDVPRSYQEWDARRRRLNWLLRKHEPKIRRWRRKASAGESELDHFEVVCRERPECRIQYAVVPALVVRAADVQVRSV